MTNEERLYDDVRAIRDSQVTMLQDVAVLKSNTAIMVQLQMRVEALEHKSSRQAGFAAAFGMILGYLLQVFGKRLW